MATTKLNQVLSALYQTDDLLYTKLSGVQTTVAGIQGDVSTLQGDLTGLSGKVSGAFGDGSYIVTSKINGIEKSSYTVSTNSDTFESTSEVPTKSAVSAYINGKITSINNAATSVTTTNTTSGSITNNALSINVKTDGKTISSDANGIKSLITLTKLTTPSAGYAATYELRDNNGTKIGDEINIPKDQFLSGASYILSSETLRLTFAVAEKDANGNATGNTIANTVDINAHDLVHEYAQGNGISVADTVNGQSIISAKVHAFGNDNYLKVDGTGLYTEGINTAISNATSAIVEKGSDDLASGKIVIGDGTNKVKTSNYSISGYAANASFSDNSVVPTQKAISGFVAEQISTSISSANDKQVTTAASNTILSSDQFVLGNNNKEVKTTGITLNTGTLSTSSDTTIPTDKVVYKAISGKIDIVENETGEIPKFKSNGQLESTNMTIGATTYNATGGFGSSSELAVESAVTGYIDNKLSANVTAAANFSAADRIVLTNANTGRVIKQSNYSIQAKGSNSSVTLSSDTQLPTAAAVSAYVSSAVATAPSAVITSSNFATADQIVTVATAGTKQVKASGKSIVTTISGDMTATNDNQVPTVKAVRDYYDDGLADLLTLIGEDNTSGLRKKVSELP